MNTRWRMYYRPRLLTIVKRTISATGIVSVQGG